MSADKDDLVLVDTSVWIEAFNHPQGREAVALNDLSKEKRVCIAGVVIAEVIRGIKTESKRDDVMVGLSALPYIEDRREDWIAAGDHLRELRDRGITVSVMDVMDAVLAQLCMHHDLAMYTLDKHFDYFTELKRYYPPIQ